MNSLQKMLNIFGTAVSLSVFLSATVYGSVIDTIDFDVTGKGEFVGKVTMKVSSFGLGGGLIGIQGLVGEFNVTKKKGDGSTMSVQKLEQFLGQDHLNWFQKVVRDTKPPQDGSGQQLKAPYIDPPNNGYSGNQASLWADNRPWLWNETPKPAGETRPEAGQLSDQVKGSSLAFEDFPSVTMNGMPVEGAQVDFVTFLVSDFGNKSYQVLGNGVSWGIQMVKVDDKGVFPHITCLMSGAPFTEEYAKEIKEGFGYTMVPEPPASLLLSFGLLELARCRRQRTPT